jgi:hypothetical protein
MTQQEYLQRQIDVLKRTVAEQGRILAALCPEGRLADARALQWEAYPERELREEVERHAPR